MYHETTVAENPLFADLHQHTALMGTDLDEEQATHLVFFRLRTEDVRHDTITNGIVSSCCRVIILYDSHYQPYCSGCGDHCYYEEV